MPARHRIATLILLSSTVASADARRPPPDDNVQPALLKLRTELRAMSHDNAVKALPRFRALCDADGYPLVGNIATKGEDDRIQPSEACRLLHAQPKAR
jgi:hypothetical protein